MASALSEEIRILVTAEGAKALKEIRGVRREIDKLKESTKGTASQSFFNNIEKQSASLSRTMTKLAIPIIGGGIAAVKVAGDYERLQTEFEVLTKSAEKGQQVFEDLREFSASTPLQLGDVASVSKILLTADKDTTKLVKTLKTLGDVSQGNNAVLQRVAFNFAQIQTIGHASTRDLREFATAGIPIFDELAETLNISREELDSFVTSGRVTSDVVARTFERMTSEGGQFHNMMSRVSQTFEGKLSTAFDKGKESFAQFGEELIPTATKIIESTAGIVEKIAEFNERSGGAVITIGKWVLIMTGLIKGVNLVTKAVKALNIALTATNKFKLIFTVISAGVGGVAAAYQAFKGIEEQRIKDEARSREESTQYVIDSIDLEKEPFSSHVSALENAPLEELGTIFTDFASEVGGAIGDVPMDIVGKAAAILARGVTGAIKGGERDRIISEVERGIVSSSVIEETETLKLSKAEMKGLKEDLSEKLVASEKGLGHVMLSHGARVTFSEYVEGTEGVRERAMIASDVRRTEWETPPALMIVEAVEAVGADFIANLPEISGHTTAISLSSVDNIVQKIDAYRGEGQELGYEANVQEGRDFFASLVGRATGDENRPIEGFQDLGMFRNYIKDAVVANQQLEQEKRLSIPELYEKVIKEVKVLTPETELGKIGMNPNHVNEVHEVVKGLVSTEIIRATNEIQQGNLAAHGEVSDEFKGAGEELSERLEVDQSIESLITKGMKAAQNAQLEKEYKTRRDTTDEQGEALEIEALRTEIGILDSTLEDIYDTGLKNEISAEGLKEYTVTLGEGQGAKTYNVETLQGMLEARQKELETLDPSLNPVELTEIQQIQAEIEETQRRILELKEGIAHVDGEIEEKTKAINELIAIQNDGKTALTEEEQAQLTALESQITALELTQTQAGALLRSYQEITGEIQAQNTELNFTQRFFANIERSEAELVSLTEQLASATTELHTLEEQSSGDDEAADRIRELEELIAELREKIRELEEQLGIASGDASKKDVELGSYNINIGNFPSVDTINGITKSVETSINSFRKMGESTDAFKDGMLAVVDAAGQVAAAIIDVASQWTEAVISAREDQWEHEIEEEDLAIERAQARGEDTVEREVALAEERLKMERELEKQREEAARKAFYAEKAIAFTMAGIQLALALVEAAPDPVALGLTAALGAVQLAFIAAQPFPGLQEGGIVPAQPPYGGTYRIGEHEPEAVIPLSQLESGGGGSPTVINITINGNLYGDEDIANRVGEAVRTAMNQDDYRGV